MIKLKCCLALRVALITGLALSGCRQPHWLRGAPGESALMAFTIFWFNY